MLLAAQCHLGSKNLQVRNTYSKNILRLGSLAVRDREEDKQYKNGVLIFFFARNRCTWSLTCSRPVPMVSTS